MSTGINKTSDIIVLIRCRSIVCRRIQRTTTSAQILATAASRRVCAVVRFSYAKGSLHLVCGPTITSKWKVRRWYKVDGAGNHGSITRVLTEENVERLVRDFWIIRPLIPILHDCFLFLHLKRRLGGQRFRDDEKLKIASVVLRKVLRSHHGRFVKVNGSFKSI